MEHNSSPQDGRHARTSDRLQHVERQGDGTHTDPGPHPAVRPGPANANGPQAHNAGAHLGFGWSQGATKNYLALSSVICGAVALVLASLLLGIVAGALAIFAGRWAAAHHGVGGPLANLGFLLGLLAMVVSNLITSTAVTGV